MCAPYRPDCSLHCWVWCWRVFYFIFSDFIIGYWLYTYCLPFRDFKGELQGRHRNQFGRGVSGVPGEEIGMDILLTQIELLIIGLGSAMLVNLVYMPNSEGAMMEIRQKVDGLFSVIFRHFSLTLRDPEHIWDGKELIEANRQIEKGIEEAKRASENQMIHPDGSWNIYFYMRKEQMENIQSMMHQISQVYERLPHGVLTAEIFDQLSKDVVAEGYTGKSEGLLIELEDRFKEMELPTTREEFEVRSAILRYAMSWNTI